MIFSIFLFGDGNSILLIMKTPKIITNTIKANFIINFFISCRYLCLYFFIFYILLNNFKIRQICDFSIKKLMESNKNIVLIGMMASGKTTIGRAIAKKLKLNFIDIDQKIEKLENKTVAEIFSKKGEYYFRKMEELISLKNLSNKKNVISLGGGGFINPKIKKKCKKNCISFWLNWSPEILISRIRRNKKRPLTFKMTDNEIKKLIIQRSKIYKDADFEIKCNKISKRDIINRIIINYENK